MKRTNRNVLLLSLLSLSLVACKPEESSESNKESLETTPTSESTSSTTPTTVELVGSYSTAATFSYMNMRPTYNYYISTFSFQTLDTYSDNSYCLTVESTCYSGLVLSEEGNEASGSERENYITRYFGTYTSKVNELDETMLDISLATPTRIAKNHDCTYYVDTADFHEVTGKEMNQDVTYTSAEDFLKAYAFKPVEVSVTAESASFDTIQLEKLDEGAQVVKEDVGPAILTSYMTPGSLSYMNMRPAYNYYMTIMNQESLDLLDTTNYRFTIYSSDFSGLTLPEEGNEASGSDRANYRLSFYGTYQKKANELDETLSEITLAAPTRVTLNYDAQYFVDSASWDDAAKEHTSYTENEEKKTYATGEDYLNSFAITEKQVSATEDTKSFDYLEYALQMY